MSYLTYAFALCLALDITTGHCADVPSTAGDHSHDGRWEYQLGLGHTLTPHTTVSVAQVFCQTGGESLSCDAIHLGLNQVIPNRKLLSFSPSLYVEYERAADLTAPNVLVLQLLFSRQFASFDASVGSLYEFAWAPGAPVQAMGLDITTALPLTEKLIPGLELHWKRQTTSRDSSVDDLYAVPTLTLASNRISYSVGCALCLADDSAEADFRLQMGFEL